MDDIKLSTGQNYSVVSSCPKTYSSLPVAMSEIIADELSFNTLEDVIYLSMRNDVSFIIEDAINLYEQQSTYNPNMPLRGLIYFGKLMAKYVESNNLYLYGTKRQIIPTPKFVVFYNGHKEPIASKDLYLSDSYEGDGDVDVVAHMVNITCDAGNKLLDKCTPLKEYAWIIDHIAQLQDDGKSLEEAVDQTLDEAIACQGVLSDLLRDCKAEVRSMCLTEYDEAKVLAMHRAEGLEEGRVAGIKEGYAAGLEEGRFKLLFELVREGTLDMTCAATKAHMGIDDFKQAYQAFLED